MNFPGVQKPGIPAKKPGGKSKRILYQSFRKGHFFSLFDKVWQKKEKAGQLKHILMCQFFSLQLLMSQQIVVEQEIPIC
jgi:hypothetical protein